MDLTLIVVVVVATALIFDFTNGFHDTANAMATSIATGALKPRTAVIIAGLLNLVGAFLSVEVARTISSGMVDETRITPVVIFAGLIGAIIWNLLTWLLGLPSSSSHALFGGLIGASIMAAGVGAVNFGSVFTKVILPALVSPLLAGVIALIGTYLAYRLTARAHDGTVRRGFRYGQIVSASMVALAHGTNDAQKTMGVITLTLITAGTSAVKFGGLISDVIIPAFASPIVAGLVAAGGVYLVYRLIRRYSAERSEREFRWGQVASSSMVALAHGTNDAQKTMGVITLTLITAGTLAPNSSPPFWVILSAGLAIALGTYLGGWRIIRTLGKRVSDIQTPQGFAAETSATAVILTSSHLGFALSTTQVATGAIFGAGAGRRLASVRWGVAGQMALAWLLTLPAAAAVGAVAAWVAGTGTIGTVVVALVALAIGIGIYAASKRRPVTADNVNDVPPVQADAPVAV